MTQTVPKSKEWSGQSLSEGQPDAAEIIRALGEIVASHPFRTSKQCQDLLRYIVHHSLDGDDTSLRERVVGVEVFGRAASYDTSEDPVVRMRAADVRKRLAQYYQSAEYHSSSVHIELRPGSYRATFPPGHPPGDSLPSVPALTSPSQSSPVILEPTVLPVVESRAGWTRARRPAALGVILLLVLSVGAALLRRSAVVRITRAQQRFWEPLTRSGRPVLLYLGSNVAYILRPEVLERYQHEHGLEYVGPEFFPDLPKGGSIRNEDLLPQRNTFVTVQDLAASAQLISLLSGWSKPLMVRSAEDVSMGELRNSPTVLIGGFNTHWTKQTMNELPFVFRNGTQIQSRTDPARAWSVPQDSRSEHTEDYALISRVLHANTGGPVLAIGGIGSFGTQAAAEFVASADQMNQLLRSAPAGWEDKNMQVVLRIKVVGYTPVGVEVVATTYW